MQTSAVSDTGAMAATTPAGRGLADFEPEDFFKLLITQLQTQDPMEPVSNSDIVQQISQIRDLEASTKLSSTLDDLARMQESLANQQRFGSATAMIGSYVEGVVADAEGNTRFTAGVVTGIRFDQDGAPILQLHDGDEVPVDTVSQVTSVEEVNRVAQQLIGKHVRGEMPGESGELITVEGIVESIRADEFGLPILVLDDGTEMPLQYFREIVNDQE